MNTDTIKNLLAHIESECKAIDREARFDSLLDECYSFKGVGGPFESMSPSDVLKECDPTAYRCGVNDYADGENRVEIDGSYYDRDEAEKARDEFLDIESEISDAEKEVEDAESDEDFDSAKLAQLKATLAELEQRAATVRNYSL